MRGRLLLAGRVPARSGGLGLCGLLAASAAASPARDAPLSGAARIARVTAAARHGLQAACPRPRPGGMRCFALVQPQLAVNKELAAGRRTHPRGWTRARSSGPTGCR